MGYWRQRFRAERLAGLYDAPRPGRNQVERWFGLITQRAIRRGSFRTVRELIRRIDAYVTRYNRTASPFAWTATAESILAKVAHCTSD